MCVLVAEMKMVTGNIFATIFFKITSFFLLDDEPKRPGQRLPTTMLGNEVLLSVQCTPPPPPKLKTVGNFEPSKSAAAYFEKKNYNLRCLPFGLPIIPLHLF